MFTGIVEEVGHIISIDRNSASCSLCIEAKKVLEGSNIGDSICVNGVCLTATSIDKGSFRADVMPETLRRSSLSELTNGSKVNLERAMAANGRFGGHIVSGHIDSTGIIKDIRPEDNAVWFTIKADKDILKYIVEKGSVALDGISLTVAGVDADSFKVSVIPHTRQVTSLAEKKGGSLINIECDILGKYVEKLLRFNEEDKSDNGTGSSITLEFLQENGF